MRLYPPIADPDLRLRIHLRLGTSRIWIKLFKLQKPASTAPTRAADEPCSALASIAWLCSRSVLPRTRQAQQMLHCSVLIVRVNSIIQIMLEAASKQELTPITHGTSSCRARFGPWEPVYFACLGSIHSLHYIPSTAPSLVSSARRIDFVPLLDLHRNLRCDVSWEAVSRSGGSFA